MPLRWPQTPPALAQSWGHSQARHRADGLTVSPRAARGPGEAGRQMYMPLTEGTPYG